eukprot:COSAG02_NODE_1633_length_11567_cov_16.719567_3_plen_81_part_00
MSEAPRPARPRAGAPRSLGFAWSRLRGEGLRADQIRGLLTGLQSGVSLSAKCLGFATLGFPLAVGGPLPPRSGTFADLLL